MTTPNLPPFYNMPYTDEKGYLTPTSKLFNDDVFQVLNSLINFVNVGLNSDWAVIPNKTTAQITTLLPNAPLGAMWFNTDTSKLQVKTATGIVQTITSS